MIAVLGLVLLPVVLPDVGQVLYEQHGQDVVLVNAGVHRAAEGIASPPDGLVDFSLVHTVVHLSSYISLNLLNQSARDQR